jgi:hypothetical protein
MLLSQNENPNRALKVLSEDLEYLAKEWNKQDISESGIRITSNLLRRLLIDNLLNNKCLRFINQELGIKKIRIMDYPFHGNVSDQEFYFHGGAINKNIEIAQVKIHSRALSASELSSSYKHSKKNFIKEPIELDKYLNSTVIVIKGVSINRAQLIKFVCNKDGGVHFDSKRDTKKSEDKVFELIDEFSDLNFKIGEMNPFYRELLNLGQKLTLSPDIQKIRKKLAKLFLN